MNGRPGSPIPVAAQVQTTVPDTGWDWTTFGDPSVVDADLAGFGQPAFANSGGWSTQTSTRLQPWARPVLATGGKDVVVRGALGAGKVLWEGLNLPYHLDTPIRRRRRRSSPGPCCRPCQRPARCRLDGDLGQRRGVAHQHGRRAPASC